MADPFDSCTLLAHIQLQPPASSHPISPPIYQTSTFGSTEADSFLAMATEPRHAGFYTRYGNPTTRAFEDAVAALEGTESALATASGMGAIVAAMLSFVSAGEHVIAQRVMYGGTMGLLKNIAPRLGIEVSFVDQTATEAFAEAIRPTTRLIMLESPSNPMMRLTDLRTVATLAKSKGIATLVDNTIASPINQTPIRSGIDLVVHSATKFLGGHHDLTAGVVAGPQALVEKIWHCAVVLGPVPDPFAAWLLLRGLRTLPLRIARQNQTALLVARFLEQHPAIARVNYPGLASHPQYALAKRQMPAGSGGLLSFELRGGFEAARTFINAMRLAVRAVSFGGFESLATQPAAMWAGSIGAEKAAEAGIPLGLIRYSVGLEHADDLIEDLRQALA